MSGTVAALPVSAAENHKTHRQTATVKSGLAPRVGLAIASALFLLITVQSVSAVDMGLPDTSTARRELESYVLGPIERPTPETRRVLRQPNGVHVLFRVERQLGNQYYLFLPENDLDFPIAQAGSYIVRRSLDQGEVDQIKVFLHADEETFVRIRPSGRRTTLDLFAAGSPIYENVPLPISIDTALILPFEEVASAASSIVNWESIVPDPFNPAHERVESMAQRVRQELPNLPDAEDGAMDSDGRLVFIESLTSQEKLPGFNCSGFAKWVVDGLVEPITGRYLAIDPLKRKHLEYRGTQWSAPLEDARDPYFGLDWSRNLAISVRALQVDADPQALNPESSDVREVPVSEYLEDTGYPVSDLPGILYWLAIREPGHIYIGSVNREYGDGPTLRQHTHVVVLFPYFTDDGRFRADVMERNVETSLESLNRRYGDDFIHLVRIKVPRQFDPPTFVDGES